MRAPVRRRCDSERVDLCSVAGCERRARSRGMCGSHYGNLMRYGHAIPVRDWPLDQRLEHVGWTVTETNCWEWNGKRHTHGYGLLTAPRLGLRNARVHRLMFGLRVRPLHDDEVVRHTCDNPPCLNPDHLLAGTMQDNSRDMVARQRQWTQGRMACPKGHDLTKPGACKRDSRCVECARKRGREHARRKRAAERSARV